jgi:flagellar protein FliS
MQKGQDIAKNLKALYNFLERYLSQANTENDPQKIDNAIEMLNSLKSAFEEILHNPAHAEVQNINKKEQVESCIKKFI